jgi:hypothetical protein
MELFHNILIASELAVHVLRTSSDWSRLELEWKTPFTAAKPD